MISIFSMLILGIFCLLCFQAGYKTSRREEILKSPISKIKEVKEQRKEEEETSKLNNVLSNLDNYNGTGNNQKEI